MRNLHYRVLLQKEPEGRCTGNPLPAGPMYPTGYIERTGTGTGEMIRGFREYE